MARSRGDSRDAEKTNVKGANFRREAAGARRANRSVLFTAGENMFRERKSGQA